MNERCCKDKLNERLRQHLPRLIWCLLAALLLGLWAHGFAMTNTAFIHDAAVTVTMNYRWQMALGRVAEPLYFLFTGSRTVMPWSSGLLSLLFIGLSAAAVTAMLGLDRPWEMILTAGIMVTNRSVIALFGAFIPWAGADCFALLLAAAAALCWYRFRERQSRLLLLAGVLCMTASLGIYQAYASVFITLVLLVSFRGLLEEEKPGRLLRQGLLAAGMLLAAGLLYGAVLFGMVKTGLVTLTSGDYNSLTNAFSGSEGILSRLAAALRQTVGYFGKGAASASAFLPPFLYFAELLALVGALLALGRLIRRGLKPVRLLLLALCLGLLLIMADAIRLLNGTVHDLMTYAVWLLLLLPLLLMGAAEKDGSGRISRLCVTAGLALLTFINVQTANLVYTKKAVEADATLSVMTDVLNRVAELPGYREGETEIQFIGVPGNALAPFPETERIGGITGVGGNSALTYNYNMYVEAILKRHIREADREELKADPRVQTLPVYPDAGCVTLIDGVAVVNFGNSG